MERTRVQRGKSPLFPLKNPKWREEREREPLWLIGDVYHAWTPFPQRVVSEVASDAGITTSRRRRKKMYKYIFRNLESRSSKLIQINNRKKIYKVKYSLKNKNWFGARLVCVHLDRPVGFKESCCSAAVDVLHDNYTRTSGLPLLLAKEKKK